MGKSSNLIEQRLIGSKASDVLDMWETTLPSPYDIAFDIRRDFKSQGIDCTTFNDKETVYVILESKTYHACSLLEIYEKAYPEYQFLITEDR